MEERGQVSGTRYFYFHYKKDRKNSSEWFIYFLLCFMATFNYFNDLANKT